MTRKIIKILLITILPIIIVTSCAHNKHREFASDLKTEGFLNDNFYQVIIQESPDKNSHGLVENRHSALLQAKKKIIETVTDHLLRYCINFTLKKNGITNWDDKKNFDKIKVKSKNKFDKILSYGYIEYKYYGYDNSAILVYRIHDNGLRNQIESIHINLEDN